MNDLLRSHPAYREFMQSLAELETVSHAPIQGYNFAPSENGKGDRWRIRAEQPIIPHLGQHSSKSGDTSVPRGNDVEHRPRSGEDRLAWEQGYHSKTTAYFREALVTCETVDALVTLRDECRWVVLRWRRSPLPLGQEPLSVSDSNWKRWVAESDLDGGTIARRYGVSRQYIFKVRQDYRAAS